MRRSGDLDRDHQELANSTTIFAVDRYLRLDNICWFHRKDITATLERQPQGTVYVLLNVLEKRFTNDGKAPTDREVAEAVGREETWVRRRMDEIELAIASILAFYYF